jgi:putative phosphoesterase
MRLGVVSDTHGHLGNTRAAVEVLRRQSVECVLHCGDLGSPDIVPLFDEWPAHFVFGNVDHDQVRLRRAIEAAQQTCHERFGILEFGPQQVAFIHSDDYGLFRETIESQRFDLVCYGHTHKAEYHQEGRTLVLNPGALYRATAHTVAVVELPQLRVDHLPV